jgi:bifunctional enzyme CysN/CysC
VAGGVFRPGDEVTVLPSGFTTTIAGRHLRRSRSTRPSRHVGDLLDDDLDVSRGDMICRPHNQPTVGQDIDAMVCWMTDRP